jgi:hypothetical protein
VPVGNDGETLVADSSATTGLRWQGNYAAGKNYLINGDFGINQRGFTSATASGTYGFDRFSMGVVDGTVTYTPQTFTTGAAPVTGYEATNFAQVDVTGQTLTTAQATLGQRMESVRTLAGQTATMSFWAKANSGTPNINVVFRQVFGSGGSPSAATNTPATVQTITTSWARYSFTVNVPSISGKTIGTTAGTDYLGVNIWFSSGSASAAPTVGLQTNTFQIWGVQVENGSVASEFQTATGTKQGELAACQRYYNRYTPGTSAYGLMSSSGYAFSTTLMRATFALPVEMRVVPTAVEYSTLRYLDSANSTGTISAANLLSSENSPKVAFVEFTSTGMTANRPTLIQTNNSTSGYVGFTAEL